MRQHINNCFAASFFEEFAQDIPINRYKYHGTFSLPFFKTRFYNLDVSTELVDTYN